MVLSDEEVMRSLSREAYYTAMIFWKDFKIHLDSIELLLAYNYTWYPPDIQTNLVSVHSPNTLPIKPGKSLYIIQNKKPLLLHYSRIETHLLEPPYSTNCQNYDDPGQYKYQMDCITGCTQSFESGFGAGFECWGVIAFGFSSFCFV